MKFFLQNRPERGLFLMPKNCNIQSDFYVKLSAFTNAFCKVKYLSNVNKFVRFVKKFSVIFLF